MKKIDMLWGVVAILLLSALALLMLLPRNGGKAEAADRIINSENVIRTAPDSVETDSKKTIVGGTSGKSVKATEEEKAAVASDLREIAEICSGCYRNAEKIPSDYGEDELNQTDIDEMESMLSGAGYCVVDSDAFYPDYLTNSDGLLRFWDSVTRNQNAELPVWSISPDGSVYCRTFLFTNGTGYCLHASGDWDDDGTLTISYLEKREILYWDMTESGLIYQDLYLDRHWTATNLLRLQSLDHTLYEWTEKYIAPIGYHNVNFFLLDWDSSDYGHVCFNDLLSGMYQMEFGEYFYAQDYPYFTHPYAHSAIPAELFESVISKHFSISLDEFRERALYDAENDAYPWQNLNCGNVLYYPQLIPEVTDVTENADGTVTLLVNVLCPDRHTDHLFEHEVTLHIESNGAFQYLSNRIVYRSENELPSPQARIEAQRFEMNE